MEYLIGLIAGLLIGATGYFARLDRDGAFYPTVLGVIATYYILFAVMAHAQAALVSEALAALLFLAAAIVGSILSQWIVVAGLIGHGLFDFVHGSLIANPGVPAWWPGFCLTVDVVLGVGLAVLLAARSRQDEGA